MSTHQDWAKWKTEKNRFKAREPLGFAKDLQALENHITAMTCFAPKDEAGWPLPVALQEIDRLTASYTRAKTSLGNLTKELAAPSNQNLGA